MGESLKFNLGIGIIASVFFAFGIYFSLQRSHPDPIPVLSASNGVVENGEQAPEIDLPSLKGKNLKLSSLKGKIVLIDFWASWCGPCRAENPNVVLVYQKYHNARFKDAVGFEIYSVSLDTEKSRWKMAVDKDKLDWKYHVSDLKGWNSPAVATYQVTGIPMNFLIDAEGKIIGQNLRGLALHKALDELISGF